MPVVLGRDAHHRVIIGLALVVDGGDRDASGGEPALLGVIRAHGLRGIGGAGHLGAQDAHVNRAGHAEETVDIVPEIGLANAGGGAGTLLVRYGRVGDAHLAVIQEVRLAALLDHLGVDDVEGGQQGKYGEVAIIAMHAQVVEGQHLI